MILSGKSQTHNITYEIIIPQYIMNRVMLLTPQFYNHVILFPKTTCNFHKEINSGGWGLQKILYADVPARLRNFNFRYS